MACEGCIERQRAKLQQVVVNEIKALKMLLSENKITSTEYVKRIRMLLSKYQGM